MKTVLLFKLSADVLALIEVVFIRDNRTVRPDPECYNMDMVTVNVFVLHYKVRHITEPHFLHILVGELGILSLTQPVVGVRIERYVHHCLLCSR